MIKNSEGDTPLNLAIRNKSFRCFELMLSMLLQAQDSYVSRNFLSDLELMIGMESPTVDKFFDMKMVDNAASKAIEKIKWSLEEEKTSIVLQSQLFTKEMIE